MDADAGETRHGDSIACLPYMDLTAQAPNPRAQGKRPPTKAAFQVNIYPN
jgi:hypothetical protein